MKMFDIEGFSHIIFGMTYFSDWTTTGLKPETVNLQLELRSNHEH